MLIIAQLILEFLFYFISSLGTFIVFKSMNLVKIKREVSIFKIWDVFQLKII